MAALCLSMGIVLAACGGDQAGTVALPAEVSVVDGARIVVNSHPAWAEGDAWRLSTEPTLVIGIDEGAAGEMLTDVRSAAPLGDGTILVIDGGSKELRFFTADGAYLRSVGGPGQGPCEFAAIGPAFSANDGSIIVADWRARRFALFAADGKCVANETLQFSDYRSSEVVGRLTAGELVLFAGDLRPFESAGAAVRWQTTHLAVLEPGAAAPSPLIQVRRFEWNGQFENLQFASFASAATFRDTIFYTDGDTYEIVVYDRDGSVTRRTSRLLLPDQVTPSDISVWQDAAEKWQIKFGRTAEARKIVDDKAFAERFPAYGRLLVDAAGNVWALRQGGLQEHLRSFTSFGVPLPDGLEPPATAQWDIYDDTGVWLGVVHVPANRWPSYVGADRIFLIGMDELGVSRVWIHQILRPPQ